MQKSRSRKNSIAAAPKDLDRIDELDETDPLGYAWHHESPYEAIKKAVESGFVPGEGGDLRNGKPKIFVSNALAIRVGTDSDTIISRPLSQTKNFQRVTPERYAMLSGVRNSTPTADFASKVITQETGCSRSQSHYI